MPRLPKDFTRALIYNLVCRDTTIKEIYVGSTTNFTERKRLHKSTCNNQNAKGYNYKVYQFIRENGNWDNWDMVLIEYYKCNTELELGRRENYWKQELGAQLNSYTPHIYENSQEYQAEYRETHREEIAEYQAEYNEANREQIAKQQKGYYEANRDQLLEQMKKYQQANKEVIAEKMKKYNQANKEKIAEQRAQKITCECGCVVSRVNISVHKKTAKHISMLKQNPLGLNTQDSSV